MAWAAYPRAGRVAADAMADMMKNMGGLDGGAGEEEEDDSDDEGKVLLCKMETARNSPRLVLPLRSCNQIPTWKRTRTTRWTEHATSARACDLAPRMPA